MYFSYSELGIIRTLRRCRIGLPDCVWDLCLKTKNFCFFEVNNLGQVMWIMNDTRTVGFLTNLKESRLYGEWTHMKKVKTATEWILEELAIPMVKVMYNEDGKV